ncbi:toxin ParE1/3/4 [Hephaestia caeni]|uniref:Toxin ParE1/3/4 n=1 Tax=Hephaestia caeni TaxID=645617 RepID=A0A397NPG5_9SPHN|nr:type II toxin-antitoxin system RelE/ParE family toxin [Hephaestia caeni]RIA35544.1 toxin ParE1/3/4 [Hephaestia caeni]
MRIVYLPQADTDLLEIFMSIASDNEPAAHRLVDRVRVAVLRLRDHPRSAPAREDIADGVRGLSVAGYIVLYRVADEVHIVRIIHAARDLPNLDLGG